MTRSITLFGDTHTVSYWLLLFGGISALIAISHYRRTHGLVGRFDYKLVAVLILIVVIEIVAWKILVMRSVH